LELQRFVTTSFEAMGGIVEPLEYALCQVLIPEKYVKMFQGRNEMKLSFDFEVAQENPDSEFVTFGSYILNQIFDIISTETVSTVRYAVIDKMSVSNACDKIKKYLNLTGGTTEIINERPVMGLFSVYTFRTGYVSDERVERIEEIWMDMLTLKPCEKMRSYSTGIFFEKEPLYIYPVPVLPDISEVFEKAYNEIKKNVQDGAQSHTRKSELAKEINRITNYYAELMEENEKRKVRKGISEEKILEIETKKGLLKLEKERQIKEMQNKYRVRTDIALENIILYAIPHIEYIIKAVRHGNTSNYTLYYNPILKEFNLK
jgi:hypothetical protein